MESELVDRFLKDKTKPVRMAVSVRGGKELQQYVLGARFTYELVDLEPEPPVEKTRRPTIQATTPSLALTTQDP